VTYHTICFVFAFVTGMLTQEQTANWNDYRPSSLKDAWLAGVVLKGADYTIEAENVKFAVVGTFAGGHRDVGTARHDLLRRWAKALDHPVQVEEMFAHEIEVRAGRESYWLPLQSPLVEPFAREVRAGDPVRLFIMYIGATGEDRLFIVNEFQALPK
jgi:hypothetical protein